MVKDKQRPELRQSLKSKKNLLYKRRTRRKIERLILLSREMIQGTIIDFDELNDIDFRLQFLSKRYHSW